MTVIEEKYGFTGTPDTRGETTHIIVHHAAAASAEAQAIHRWHLANGWLGIGYHYYVRKNGEIFRGRPESAVGAHAADMNSCSIGICFEGNFENEGMGQVQFDAGKELIADILSRYGELTVSRHCDHNATACPGANFPFEELVKAAKENDDEPSEWAREAAQWR